LPATEEDNSPYIRNWGLGHFIRDMYDFTFKFYYAPERKTYDIDLDTKQISLVDMEYDYNDVVDNICGFSLDSDWSMYNCHENAFNSLDDLINNNITGNQHSRERQIEAYMAINASPGGDCGEKVYRYLNNR
jgi:hypothetical protein